MMKMSIHFAPLLKIYPHMEHSNINFETIYTAVKINYK
jgi:hypothetical protein